MIESLPSNVRTDAYLSERCFAVRRTIRMLTALASDLTKHSRPCFGPCSIVFTARRFARAVLATAIPSLCPSVRPFVRLTHAGIVSKRRHGALYTVE